LLGKTAITLRADARLAFRERGREHLPGSEEKKKRSRTSAEHSRVTKRQCLIVMRPGEAAWGESAAIVFEKEKGLHGLKRTGFM